jgi:exopolysaccharide biosynthesis predicted pyruvyltransferase EpsI
MTSSHPTRPAAAGQLITQLRQQIEEVLRPLLADAGTVALLGFPNYPNVGDSAIWLGTLACLRTLGKAPCYVCDYATYSREHLAQRVGHGTILLHGGGNLGDLWEVHQRFREEVIQAFPENRIVQLPQTIHFQKRAALAHARAVFDRHPHLTLVVRDQKSLMMARNEFRAPSVLCPDLAFSLGPLSPPAPARRAVVWLARSDEEGASTSRAPAGAGVEPVDWLSEREPAVLLVRWLVSRSLLPVPLRWGCDWLARQRLQRGMRVLSAGHVVITDRLHGHILCMLLGIPHVLLDNSYGKVRSFYDTWTQGCDLVRWRERGSDAMRCAGELVERPR